MRQMLRTVRWERRRQKTPVGGDRGFCGLPVCRSDGPIRIVGGQNDANRRMHRFYLDCNSLSSKLTTNCAHTADLGGSQGRKPREPLGKPVERSRCNLRLRHDIQKSGFW